jgi:signal transduction histidine kinase
MLAHVVLAIATTVAGPIPHLPIEPAPVATTVDWRRVQQRGVDASPLPPELTAEYREPSERSAWGSRRPYIIGALVEIVLLGGLLAGLTTQWAKRRTAEREARRNEAALHTRYERIRHLVWRLLKAQEDERSRIARDLHDDISQQLAVLTLDLKILRRRMNPSDEAAVAEVVKRAEGIGTSVHDLAHRLHPARLRLLGLVEALEGLKREQTRPDVTITLTHQNIPATLPSDLTLCLFRIVQEGLQNALEHGKARNVSVDLTGAPRGIALTVADDGVGFDVEAGWHSGLGLSSVNERVEAFGGKLDLRSSRGGGTRLAVTVRVPILSPPHRHDGSLSGAEQAT